MLTVTDERNLIDIAERVRSIDGRNNHPLNQARIDIDLLLTIVSVLRQDIEDERKRTAIERERGDRYEEIIEAFRKAARGLFG